MIERYASSSDIAHSFASPADHAVCRRIHRKHGTTYYFAASRFKKEIRRRTHAIYAFVRVPDEWVDNAPELDHETKLKRLREWRLEYLHGIEGVTPKDGVMRAFCDVVQEAGIPHDEPLKFLDAMEQDLEITRYETFEDLRGYMRGSAVSVGLMMLSALGAPQTARTVKAASALGEAMQLTNFLRDVGEDALRGRIYLPEEDMASFGVSDLDILRRRHSEAFSNLMRFEIARARALYAEADAGITQLPPQVRYPIRLARLLYSRILDRIEALDYDVFRTRARTSKVEKLLVAIRELFVRS